MNSDEKLFVPQEKAGFPGTGDHLRSPVLIKRMICIVINIFYRAKGLDFHQAHPMGTLQQFR